MSRDWNAYLQDLHKRREWARTQQSAAWTISNSYAADEQKSDAAFAVALICARRSDRLGKLQKAARKRQQEEQA